MTIGLATDIRTARMEVIAEAIDAASEAGYINLYSGTRPATGGAVNGNTLLATVTLTLPCASAVTNGVLTLNHAGIAETAALDDGTVAWARVYDGDGNFVMDCSVSETGQGGDITVNTTRFVTDGPITVTSGTLTDGNA